MVSLNRNEGSVSSGIHNHWKACMKIVVCLNYPNCAMTSITDSNNYRFERLNASNIVDLSYVFEAAFGRNQHAQHFIQKNDTSCFGVTNLGYIAYSESGEPAAFYCAYACIVEYQGKQYKAAQIGDAMTHPSHQRKGLFKTLAQLTHETAKQEGIPYLFTFPNKSANSYPGFIKQQWVETGGWQSYIIRVRGISHKTIRRIIPFSDAAYMRYCRFILKFFSVPRCAFANSVMDNQTGGVLRSTDFLNYKTYTPNFFIRLKSKAIWLSIRGKTLLIGDIERCDDKTFQSVVARLKSLARLLGLGYIEFRFSAGIAMEDQFNAVKSWKYDNTQTALLYFNLDETFPGHAIRFTIADKDTY